MMHKVLLTALVAACAVLVIAPAALAAKGGNSANAKLCQKGGWEDWVTAQQTPFQNEGQCVSYAAQGGTLTAPAFSASRAACEAIGGTFSTDPASNLTSLTFDVFLWSCNGASVSTSILFFPACLPDGGNAMTFTQPGGGLNGTCWVLL